jgi:hypothetical protein
MRLTQEAIAPLALLNNATFNGSKAGLFTFANGGLSEETVLADLTEATFGGYARGSAITWGSELRLQDGGYGYVGGRQQWVANATPGGGEVILGAFIVDGSNSPTLQAAGLFDEPISIINPGDGVNWNPGLALKMVTDYANLPGPQP